MRFATRAIHAGIEPDPTTGAIMTPVYLTSTYVQEAPGKHKGYEYSRSDHPTRAVLERNLAALEGVEYGLAFASGLAAENTILNLLQAGDHVLATQDLYGGTYRLFQRVWAKFGLEFSFVSGEDPDEVRRALKSNTKLLWIETPSNPLLNIVDIRALSEVAHERGVLVVVDNTFATPYLQRPIELGADIVVHSTTKYLGGHSDVVGGALCIKDRAIYEQLKFYQNAVGAVPGPLDCFLVLRGIKTLALRMRQHCENAQRIAEYLAQHPDGRLRRDGLAGIERRYGARPALYACHAPLQAGGIAGRCGVANVPSCYHDPRLHPARRARANRHLRHADTALCGD
jgi:cystathionine gamma-lyase